MDSQIFSHYLIYLLPLVFLAYFCKATTGFGSMIVMLALGSIIIGPLPALILTTSLDVVGGLTLLRLDSTKDSRRMWLPLSLAMLLGVVVGALLLRLFALRHFPYVIGSTLLMVGLWLVFLWHRMSRVHSGEALPETHRSKDLAMCLLAGTSGGLTGISAPPLIYYFSNKLAKAPLRRILTRIFLVESVTRVVTYSVMGVMRRQIFIVALLAVPVMYFGLYVGNRAFFRIPEVWFSRLAGVVAIAAAVRLFTS